MGTNQSGADNDTALAALMRETAAATALFSRNARRFKRSDIDAWCAASGPSAYTSKGEPGAVRR